MNHNIICKILDRRDSYEYEIYKLNKELHAFKRFFHENVTRDFGEFMDVMILDDHIYSNKDMYFLLKEYLREDDGQNIMNLPTFMVTFRNDMYGDLKNFSKEIVFETLDEICLASKGKIYSREEIDSFREYCKNKFDEKYEFSESVEKYNEEYEEFKRNKK